MLNLENKKILVTGASSGIGRQIAIDLSKQGAKVVLIARNEENLKETLSKMKANSHQIIAFDLENTEEISNLIKTAVSFDGIKFDGFVHCAGVAAIYPLRVIDYAKFQSTFNINFYSYLEITKVLSKKTYSNDNSSVVYISSDAINDQTSSQILYIASKAASQNIAKVLAKELKKRNFRFNNILPSWVDTNMVKDSEIFRDVKEQNIAIKGIHPKEISNAALFLLSDKAKFINGENILVK